MTFFATPDFACIILFLLRQALCDLAGVLDEKLRDRIERAIL